jgi:hypothetical protein
LRVRLSSKSAAKESGAAGWGDFGDEGAAEILALRCWKKPLLTAACAVVDGPQSQRV